eukprot:scaffold23267_cov112-Isochrysis_galbana.AAC.2
MIPLPPPPPPPRHFRRAQHGGVGQIEIQKKTHRGSRRERPQTHICDMHPLGLLLSITFRTILAFWPLTAPLTHSEHGEHILLDARRQ